MTLHPRSLSAITEMTATVARTSFPKGNPYMKMRDELGVLYEDTDFITLFRADCGQSARVTWAISINQRDAICRGIDRSRSSRSGQKS